MGDPWHADQMVQIGKKQKAALERRYGVRTGDGWTIGRRSRRSPAWRGAAAERGLVRLLAAGSAIGRFGNLGNSIPTSLLDKGLVLLFGFGWQRFLWNP